jgi:hypothetical protein
MEQLTNGDLWNFAGLVLAFLSAILVFIFIYNSWHWIVDKLGFGCKHYEVSGGDLLAALRQTERMRNHGKEG